MGGINRSSLVSDSKDNDLWAQRVISKGIKSGTKLFFLEDCDIFAFPRAAVDTLFRKKGCVYLCARNLGLVCFQRNNTKNFGGGTIEYRKSAPHVAKQNTHLTITSHQLLCELRREN